MLDWVTHNISIPASFATVATNVTAGISYGKDLYTLASPVYTDYLLYRYGKDIVQSQGKNLTAMGNFALTILSMPGVQENLTKAIQVPTGLDESMIQTYLNGAVTCLNVAAVVLPMVSSYLTPTKETQENVEKIKDSVTQIETSLKQQKEQKAQSHLPKEEVDERRKKILTQYPKTQTKKSQSKQQHKHKHRHKHKPKH